MFCKFRVWAERQRNMKILALQTDNAKEYLKLGKPLAEIGIDTIFTPTNGVGEKTTLLSNQYYSHDIAPC